MFPKAKKVTKKDLNPNPRKIAIVKPPKTGGTRLVGQLEDALIIDFDNSSDFYETKAQVFDVKKEWEKFNENSEKKIPLDVYAIKYIYHLHKQCVENGPVGKYLVIDTVTQFEELAKALALVEYKKTAMGRSFSEDDITLLPMGAGQRGLYLVNCWNLLRA